MADFFHQNLSYFLSGISVGGQYALIAIGYTMVYGILRLINFAHGDVFMCAGLMMVYFSSSLPFAISIPAVLLLTLLLGFVIERVAYKPLRSAPRMSVMISAIGVSYLLQNAALYFTGGLAKVYPEIPFLSRSVQIWGATTRVVTLVTPVLTVVLVVLLTLLIKHTKIGMAGQAMLAVSEDKDAAQLMGVNVNKTIAVTFAIGSGLAAIAGVLLCSSYPVLSSTTGSMPGIKAFTAAVFGGIGSIPGAVIGAFIIGICENIIKGGASIFGIPGSGWTTFSDAFTFAFLIIVLIVRPTGLFGEKSVDKV